jgi:glycosyltransferase involved in cell wall biosynthesis
LNRLLFVTDNKIAFSEAPSSRILSISKILKDKKIEPEILGMKGENITWLNNTQISGLKYIARLKIILYTYTKALLQHNHIIVRGGSLAFFFIPLKILNKKIIVDFHGYLFEEINRFYPKTLYNKLKVAFYYPLEKTGLRYCNLIVCKDQETKDSLGKNEKSKSIVLENGLDLKETERAIQEAEQQKRNIYKEYSLSGREPLIGFLGNWERKYSMETMLAGCEKAKVKIIIVGEGPDIEQYKKKWRNALFIGKRPRFEALKLISLCNAAIVPYTEDKSDKPIRYSSRKVRDYLGLGKPILMADVKGREKFLVPYENAVFYRPDSPEDLAEKIRIVISDKKLQEKMQENNLKLSHQFDWQVLVEKSGLLEILN